MGLTDWLHRFDMGHVHQLCYDEGFTTVDEIGDLKNFNDLRVAIPGLCGKDALRLHEEILKLTALIDSPPTEPHGRHQFDGIGGANLDSDEDAPDFTIIEENESIYDAVQANAINLAVEQRKSIHLVGKPGALICF